MTHSLHVTVALAVLLALGQDHTKRQLPRPTCASVNLAVPHLSFQLIEFGARPPATATYVTSQILEIREKIKLAKK